MMRTLKREYIEEALGQSKGDGKKLWHTIRELWPSNKSHTDIININGATDSHNIAEIMNDHFVTIGPKLSENFRDKIRIDTPENEDDRSFIFDEIKYEDVLKLLQELSPSKACRIDGITARLLKASGDAIIPPLLHIFNNSIRKSKFPGKWQASRCYSRTANMTHHQTIGLYLSCR